MRSSRNLIFLLVLLGSFCVLTQPLIGQADEYHYKDILIGERASGMGGAFTAVSDDPSGIFYNPAGLAYSLENYFSLSANAYNVSEQKFKNIVPGQDYSYKSQGLIPVFFGFTQSYGKNKLGFAVIVPNSETQDQNDKLTISPQREGDAKSFERRLFRQDTTYLVGPAFARELNKSLTFGVSFLGFYRTDKFIDNQIIYLSPRAGHPDYFLQTSSEARSAFGFYPKLGFEFMPTPKWALGLTVTRPVNLSGSANYKTTQSRTKAGDPPINYNGSSSNDLITVEKQSGFFIPEVINTTLGTACFISQSWLLSADLSHYTGVAYPDYPVMSMFNWSVGSEVYLNESFALRSGIFTNRAKTPELDPARTDQPPHVNMLGGSVGFSFYKPGSSLTVSTSYSAGTGLGQAIGSNLLIQTVSQSNLTVYLTASYQL